MKKSIFYAFLTIFSLCNQQSLLARFVTLQILNNTEHYVSAIELNYTPVTSSKSLPPGVGYENCGTIACGDLHPHRIAQITVPAQIFRSATELEVVFADGKSVLYKLDDRVRCITIKQSALDSIFDQS